MTARLSLLLAFVALPALAAPTVVAPPLKPGKGVPAAIGAQFDISLRKALAKKATLIGSAQTSAGLRAAGASGSDNCNTDACGEKLAKATKARFVISATVSSADEIYQVLLTTYDAGRKERSVIKGVCELCTAGEVNGTIANAVGRLDKTFTKPMKAPEPAKPKTQPLQITSVPPGAEILLDGKPVGQTPKTVSVLPGSHTLTLQKKGFVPNKATVIVANKPTAFAGRLKASPPPVAVAPPSAAPPSAAPPVVTPPKPPVVTPPTPGVPGAPGKYNTAAWGMIIGGAALAGVGTWLIVLDGEVTCDDGRGRTTCPNVYNTKGVGIAGLGLGAALIGASIAVFAVGPPDDAPRAGFDMLPEGGGMVRFGGQF
jgi:hypothetical protein